MIEKETIYQERKDEISPAYFLERLKNEVAEKMPVGEKREIVEDNVREVLLCCDRYVEAALAISRIGIQTQFRDKGPERMGQAHQREHLAHQVLCDQVSILARICRKNDLSVNWYEQFLGPGGKIDRNRIGEWGFSVFQEQNRKFDSKAI